MSCKVTCVSRSIVFVVWSVLVLLCSASGFGDVRLPAVISDNMVLQRDSAVPIWGWADAGEEVSVKGSWMRKARSSKAGADGKWMVRIKVEGLVGGPYEVTVAGKNTMKIKNVLVGEVWVCSGQSNMQWSLERATNSEKEIAAASYPQIRLFSVERNASGQALDDCVGSWSACSPETAGKFSAVGYFFGRELHRELKAAVGLINTSWGGTRIEPWTPPVGFESVGGLEDIRKEIAEADGKYRSAVAEKLDGVEAWVKQSRRALETGGVVPAAPAWPAHPLGNRGRPTGLYNAMVHPLVPFGMRGAIWYQGESNRADGLLYFEKMEALIGGWRKVWGRGDFPFYYVQLAPFRYKNAPTLLAQIWEAQKRAMSVPNTGMAVTVDIGNLDDIHPKNKQDVGKRLASWALAKTYGREGLVYSGPLYKSMSVEGEKVRIRFEHVGGGLVSRDGKALRWFTIAGPEREFVEAEAKIEGETVVVGSVRVAKPVAVRFGWHQEAAPNLMNREGLPASPFRTDAWPVAAESKE